MYKRQVLGGLDRYFSLTDECADEELRGYFDSNGNRVPSGKARRELSRGLYRRLLVCVQDGRAVETLKKMCIRDRCYTESVEFDGRRTK